METSIEELKQIKMENFEAGKIMAWQLRVIATFSEDLNSVPNTHVRGLTTLVIPASYSLMPSFGL